ncbi:holin [Xenorhabdus sp. 12]|uniref:Holin n=1 Tax=Xenorhabdus santafensis TaxID=2582833 RepID=A0ABU4SES7_9GAMM|nr:phage holin family protein [Xenorhabdus sp. 12]MDX7989250.1 holin [Xenorhabdus sp. 12]
MRMDKYTSPSAYGWGAFTAMLGALSLNDWAIIVGIICTAGTFAVNWYYKHREFNRNGKDQD